MVEKFGLDDCEKCYGFRLQATRSTCIGAAACHGKDDVVAVYLLRIQPKDSKSILQLADLCPYATVPLQRRISLSKRAPSSSYAHHVGIAADGILPLPNKPFPPIPPMNNSLSEHLNRLGFRHGC